MERIPNVAYSKKYSWKSQTYSSSLLFIKMHGKIIIFKLSYYIENNCLLSPAQFGIRKKLSFLDCLSILISEIYTAFMKNKFIVIVPLDIKGAFDNVNPNILLQDLANLNIPFKIRMFIFNLLTNRNLTFKCNNILEGPYPTLIGLPQGCIGSPLEFNIYTRNADKHIDPNCKILQYADDTLIYCVHSNLDSAIHFVQKSLDSLVSYFEKRNLFLSGEKSKLIIFSTK